MNCAPKVGHYVKSYERFPDTFRFQLTEDELRELVAICDQLVTLKHSSTLPYAFTEEGVAMLSTVLHSKTAVRVSIRIMQAFVAMRKHIFNHAGLIQRINAIEIRHNEADKKFDEIVLVPPQRPREKLFAFSKMGVSPDTLLVS